MLKSLFFVLTAGSFGMWLGIPNALYQIPLAILLYPVALLYAGKESAQYEKKAFTLGWLCGMSGASACLYWIAIPIHDVGQLPWILAIPCALLIGAYIGIYGGIFAALVCHILQKYSFSIWIQSILFGLIWYFLEWFRGWFCSGFPWISLASAFAPWTIFIQATSVLGVYGLSGLFVSLISLVVLSMYSDSLAKKPLFVALTGFLLLMIFGFWRMETLQISDSSSFRMALIQGNIDQNVKWDPQMQESTVQQYLQLSAQACEDAPDILILPETSMPFDYKQKGSLPKQIRKFAIDQQTALLFGAPAFQKKVHGEEVEIFNRAYLISSEGSDLGYYEKEHLVPFGEYLPKWLDLPFLRPLLQGVGNFSPGKNIFPISVKKARLGVLICYETIFPELARQRVEDGATVLINISNDAWFGKSAAAKQHLQLSAIRAVEEGRWLARSTNTGISAFVDPLGRIVESSNLFMAQRMLFDVSPLKKRTLFSFIGSFLPIVAILLFGVIMYRNRFKRG